MRLLQTGTLILWMSIPLACGNQLVEFGRGDTSGSSDPDGGAGTESPPTVIATGPSNAATSVSVNEQIGVTFSIDRNQACAATRADRAGPQDAAVNSTATSISRSTPRRRGRSITTDCHDAT